MRVIFYGHQETKLYALKSLWSNLWIPTGRCNTIAIAQRNEPRCRAESDQKAEEPASARNSLPKAVCVHHANPFVNGRGSTSCPGMEIPDNPPSLTPFGSSYLLAFLQPLTPIMASNLKVTFLFLWLLQCRGKKAFFNSFCLLSRLFILEHFQLLSFANFQRSPLGICTLLLFLSFKRFKAERENPRERGNMGEGLDNLNKTVWLFPWHVLLKLMAPGIL